jgi:hypothetical protein
MYVDWWLANFYQCTDMCYLPQCVSGVGRVYYVIYLYRVILYIIYNSACFCVNIYQCNAYFHDGLCEGVCTSIYDRILSRRALTLCHNLRSFGVNRISVSTKACERSLFPVVCELNIIIYKNFNILSFIICCLHACA